MPAPKSETTPAPPEVCAVCGTRLLSGPLAAQCPRCLLHLASSLGVPTDEELAADDLLDPLQVRRFGDYELLEEIARGGMGVVYRGWQVSAEREVAVKMILDGQLATPQAIARFRHEAAVAAKLDHPNIVPVYEVGEIDAQHFYAMRFIGGKRNVATWARALPAEQRLATIARQMAHVARTVAFAHGRGVLHRDLKPSNVLIDEHNQPQVTDFGLAKLIDDPDAAALTLSTAILGSPSYMAPEQAEPRGRTVTAATDVYGLGAILYELISGRPPFTGDSPLRVVRQVLEATPRRLLEVPEPLDTICRKCLAKDPAQRYPTATALAEDLERFASGREILAERESTLAQLAAWSRRHPAVASLLLALLVTLLVGFGTTFWQWRRTQAANDGLRRSLFHLEWRQLDVLIERDFAGRALGELAQRLRANPHSWQSATYALSILEQRPFAFPSAPPLLIESEWLALPPALSAEGQRVALADRQGRVRLLDTTRGTEVTSPLALGPLGALAFSPDGTRLAVGQKDGTLVLCDAVSGKILGRSATDAAPLRALTFSDDGKVLAFAGGTKVGRGRVASFAQSQPPDRTRSLAFTVTKLRSSADGDTLLAWTPNQPGSIAIWAPPGDQPLFSPPGIGRLRTASLAADGRSAALVVDSQSIEIWDVPSSTRVVVITVPSAPVEHVAITPDGARVIAATTEGSILTFSIPSGQQILAQMGHRYRMDSFFLSADGAKLLTANREPTARLWDTRLGRPLVEAISHEGAIKALTLDRLGKKAMVLCEAADKRNLLLHSWEVHSGDPPQTFCPEGGRDHEASRVSPDERLLAMGTSVPRTSLSVFEIASGRPVLDRAPVAGPVYACEFTPDGRRLIVATSTGWLYGWKVPSHENPWEWTPAFAPVQTPSHLQPATLSPSGDLIALGGSDGQVRLYDTQTGGLVREFRHGALIKTLRFSSDGARIVTGGQDGVAHVWRASSGEKIATLRGHASTIYTARFSSDGTRILTSSDDFTARLWDATTGSEVIPPLKHHVNVATADISPDGRRIATGCHDATVRIWDATAGRLLAEPLLHPSAVAYVAFHPDGRRFLTFDTRGFRLWDTETIEPVTGRYPQSVTTIIALDSPSLRDLFSPSGTHLVASNAMSAAVFWPLLDPPVPVPAWFPDFLSDLANGGIDRTTTDVAPDRARLFRWKARVAQFQGRDYYEKWALRYLGLAAPPAAPPAGP